LNVFSYGRKENCRVVGVKGSAQDRALAPNFVE
jgi:hypothetical protein